MGISIFNKKKSKKGHTLIDYSPPPTPIRQENDDVGKLAVLQPASQEDELSKASKSVMSNKQSKRGGDGLPPTSPQSTNDSFNNMAPPPTPEAKLITSSSVHGTPDWVKRVRSGDNNSRGVMGGEGTPDTTMNITDDTINQSAISQPTLSEEDNSPKQALLGKGENSSPNSSTKVEGLSSRERLRQILDAQGVDKLISDEGDGPQPLDNNNDDTKSSKKMSKKEKKKLKKEAKLAKKNEAAQLGVDSLGVKKKKKRFFGKIAPSTKDTASISPTAAKEDEVVSPEESQYKTAILEEQEDTGYSYEEGGIELGLSFGGGDDVIAPMRQSTQITSAQTRQVANTVTPESKDVDISSVNKSGANLDIEDDKQEDDKSRQNLESLFNSVSDDEVENVDLVAAASAVARAKSQEEKQVVTRTSSGLNRRTGSSGLKMLFSKKEKNGYSDRKFVTESPNKEDTGSRAATTTPGTPVPPIIHEDDEASLPSMLTEPESIKRLRKTGQAFSVDDAIQKDYGNNKFSATRATTPSVSMSTMGGQETQSNAGFTTALTSAGFTTHTMMSSASQAGGIEKLLGMFNCNEDTTIGAAVTNVANAIQCQSGAVCGGGNVLSDEVDMELEMEERFTLNFQNDVIKNGVKLIYHESPSRSSPNPDWIQSTVKLFLRPGDCCNPNTLKQPTLSWAVLPVVSRMKMGVNDDDQDTGKSSESWSRLGVLDVNSILIDEGAVSTGFFSVTAANGAVYVFEAPTADARDYVVKGLRAMISRLTYYLIEGNANVIGELFCEDAGQLTGELPSLVPPWKALSRVTYAFLQQQRFDKKERLL